MTFFFLYGIFGMLNSKEDIAFMKDGSFRRIDVFRFIASGLEGAAGKSDDLAAIVRDREYHTAEKSILVL